jgi:kynureninase
MASSHNRERARELDSNDPLAFTRSEFNIPTKAEIASTRLSDKCSPSKSHMLILV